ncbi:hypothetical protein HOG98_04575 [bacterium]|nr:hypothetical protein [bacterium]
MLERYNKKNRIYHQQNLKINQRNKQYASKNPYGFTDKIHLYKKNKGQSRIAILGDSFIWGDGLPYELTWGHLLKQKGSKKDFLFTTMLWGRNGWESVDEFRFYKNEGVKYDIDMLIIGWVNNDVNMGNFKVIDYKSVIKKNSRYLNAFFPNFIDLVSMVEEKIYFSVSGKQNAYVSWLTRLYSDKNLIKYMERVVEFDSIMKKKGVPYFYVFTPNNHSPTDLWYYEKVSSLFEKHKIPFIDLSKRIEDKLGHYSLEELKSNPVNWHPGPLVTDYISTEVMNHLLSNYKEELKLN